MAASELILLARVPDLLPVVRKHCAEREEKFPYFREGFVSMDLGRHTNYTDDIRKATTGYALADERGNVIQSYRSLINAENARIKATVRVVPEVDVEPDEAPVAAKA